MMSWIPLRNLLGKLQIINLALINQYLKTFFKFCLHRIYTKQIFKILSKS